jgi:hypothetical protein
MRRRVIPVRRYPVGVLVRSTGALVVACALLTALPAGAAAKFTREPQKVYDDYRSDAAIEPCDHTVATYRKTLKQITPDVEEATPAFRPAVEAALREREDGKQGCLQQDSPTQPGTSGGGAAGGTSGGASGGSDTTPSPPAQPAPPAPTPAPAPPSSNAPAPAGGGGGTAPSVQATPAPTVAPPPPVANSAPPAPTAPTLLNRPHEGTPTGLLIALGLLALTALLGALALLARRFGWGEERLAGTRHAWGEATYRAGATWADFIDWIRLGRGPHRL